MPAITDVFEMIQDTLHSMNFHPTTAYYGRGTFTLEFHYRTRTLTLSYKGSSYRVDRRDMISQVEVLDTLERDQVIRWGLWLDSGEEVLESAEIEDLEELEDVELPDQTRLEMN